MEVNDKKSGGGWLESGGRMIGKVKVGLLEKWRKDDKKSGGRMIRKVKVSRFHLHNLLDPSSRFVWNNCVLIYIT